MPNVSVDVNGTRVATIGLTGLEMVNVAIFAALDSDPKARLTAFGGNYAPDGCGHLIWIDERAFLPGDVLTVTLNDHGDYGDPGNTIDELYRGEEPVSRSEVLIGDAIAAECLARPRLHEAFMARVETSTGQRADAASNDQNTDLQFMVVWHTVRPDQARVRLATFCMTDVLARQAGTEQLNATLAFNESVAFVLVS